MKLETSPHHLTYCTNIHAGETWKEVRANLERYVVAVKARMAPDRPFGVGLRLSAQAAEELDSTPEREAFRDFLRRQGLYVFTINGFPYGPFHGTRVKEDVYRPDWLEEPRLVYTDRLARLLADLLPDEPGLEGTVSTAPGAFKARVANDADIERMAELMIRHVVTLVRLSAETGKVISLAVEPEPWCHMETVDETIAFFEDRLFGTTGVSRLVALTGLSRPECERALRRHLGVCFDACHMAVGFEEPAEALARLQGAGIRVGKVQISAGLKVLFTGQDSERFAALRPFAEGVYLHQVVERRGGTLKRYVDLPEALAEADSAETREWRIHFHVPLFRDRLGPFVNTQDYLRTLLDIVRRQGVSPHLEVETYTWDVLPEEYRREDIVTAVTRELDWVREQLTR